VENKEQLDYLHSIECDMVQGYYLSPPKAPEKIFTAESV
jgi:EAL domain-containing protein (putative c-di-GMP-specific phosphodiesterase class I)